MKEINEVPRHTTADKEMERRAVGETDGVPKHTAVGKEMEIDYLRFYVQLKNISLICRRHHYR
jgi:hypothetical protein